MENKYLTKIAGLAGGIGRKIGIGAAIGGVSGAALAGKDNRIAGALGGATAGGVAGSLFGRKVGLSALASKKSLGVSAPKMLAGPNLAPNVVGIGNSKSPLAGKMRKN